MQQIVPFKSTDDALVILDNGGHFFNLATKANDGIVTKAELGKVAGVYADKQQMSVFLSMSVLDLTPVAREQVLYSLSPELKTAFEQYYPIFLTPAQAATQAEVSSSAVMTGVPRRIDAKSEFKGFIMIPIFAGSVMTMSMIPIIDRYDVYEIYDEQTSDTFFVAHTHGKEKLPETKLQLGGVIKEFKPNKADGAGYVKFLEAFYYREL
ncbi:hypothetical protein [Mucilaginibacter lacusdianchii]|uniref:hypothetical protein n=1 Tax=Mucilaginibacter lacusdianchii TaxID=2684211 RepID=UPI0018EED364|nr:hypothetical protein [Mucilaginibacter sp. JXJ CY 39]